jgi:Papain-like cysteine protease AvrRpt2
MKTWILGVLAVSAVLQLARPDRIDIQAAGTVDIMRQPSDNTCWATVATMLVRWRDQKPYTLEEAMTLAGPHHLVAFKSDQPLQAAGKDDFLASLGLMAEAPQDFTIAGWGELLDQYGPLWVTLQSGRLFSVTRSSSSASRGTGRRMGPSSE